MVAVCAEPLHLVERFTTTEIEGVLKSAGMALALDFKYFSSH
jgi:hypothetical protein